MYDLFAGLGTFGRIVLILIILALLGVFASYLAGAIYWYQTALLG